MSRRHRALINHGEELEIEKMTDPFTQASWANIAACWSFVEGVSISSNGGTGSIRRNTWWTAGVRYRITLSVIRTAGRLVPPYDGTTQPTNITASGEYSYTYCPGAAIMYLYSSSFNGTITAMSIKEILTEEITEILNVGAPLGVIKERWGATLTNTAVTLFQDGDVNAMEFNGVNSLINCGTMDPLIGDKSFVLWLRGYEYSGPNTFFIGTTIFALAFDTPNDLLHITSDGGGTIANDAYVLPLNEYTFIAVTRTADGLIDFYENGVLLYSGLDTGTPEAGTDIKLNLEPTSFRGLMADARIYDGLLSAPEISSLFTNESKKYLL